MPIKTTFNLNVAILFFPFIIIGCGIRPAVESAMSAEDVGADVNFSQILGKDIAYRHIISDFSSFEFDSEMIRFDTNSRNSFPAFKCNVTKQGVVHPLVYSQFSDADADTKRRKRFDEWRIYVEKLTDGRYLVSLIDESAAGNWRKCATFIGNDISDAKMNIEAYFALGVGKM